ncbi:hypothetical protein ABIB57_000726 [Devosia sp. UYZn731]
MAALLHQIIESRRAEWIARLDRLGAFLAGKV